MFVYFNKEGVIKEIINDSSIRQGNANVNTVYFFIEGADPQTATDTNGMYYKALFFSLGRYTMYLLDEHGEPLPSIEGESFDLTTVKMEVPYDKKKELKYFKYFTRYEMFQLPIPQEVLNYKGTVGLKFQMVNNDAINTQGLIVFNIEGTSPDLEIASDTAITIAEWNYLLANMLTPGDVYTKAEANSTFQEKLIAGENITIEDNVISATGGGSGSRAEWGSITGNIEDQTDLQTELSGKQNTLTFDNTPTDGSSNPVTSDGIYDAVQNVREVAEGKCNTYILSYADTIASVKADIQQHSNVKVFNGSKIDITANVLNGAYDNQTFGNTNFNSQSNEIYCFQSPYYTYLIVRITGGYMILAYIDVYYKKKGDIYLVIETDVPDRWYGNDYTFYKLETSKVDLTNYATLSGNNTFTGDNKFTKDIEAPALVHNSGALWLGAASGVQVGSHLFPGAVGTLNLGHSYYTWKDLYLSGKAIIYGTGGREYHIHSSNGYYLDIEYINNGSSEGSAFNVQYGSIVNTKKLMPMDHNTYDIGEAGTRYKDLYLSNSIDFGNGAVIAKDATSRVIVKNGNNTTILKIGGIGSTYCNASWTPDEANTYTLGRSGLEWKDLYLSGKVNFGNDAYITKDQYDRITLNVSDNAKIIVDAGQTYVNNNLLPLTATRDLGSNDYKWQNLYLSGNITDGPNSISVANIANKNNFVSLTQAQYDALATKDPDTFYFIEE